MLGTQITTVFSKAERPYTGVELRPHFLLTEMGLKGSGIGVFIGPCLVKTEHLVDWEDRLVEDRIEAKWMIHFIGEFFGCSLVEGVLIQRLFMARLLESLRERLSAAGSVRAGGLRREGDDLFVGDRKLSVSIVTSSPVSQLLHTGINIDPSGAPVPAIGLSELGIRPDDWVPEVLAGMAEELGSVGWACVKVRPVI